MKILVTGANECVGNNLIAELHNQGYSDIYEYSREDNVDQLDTYTKDCDFVFHLAGVNRPKDEQEFIEENVGLTSNLLHSLKKNNNQSPVLLTSSTQAESDNAYGKSKKAAEDAVFNYGQEAGTEVFVYRLPNLFGKWSKPNYNSVIATFCHNIARDKDIQMNNPNHELTLCYIDDVLKEFMKAMEGTPTMENNYGVVEPRHNKTLKQIAELIKSFKESRKDLSVANLEDPFSKKLYSTYLSYLPTDDFSYDLKMNLDERGSFTAFLKTPERGQVSINVSKPGITKGNHWHHTKNEKFLVVSGEGLIRFRPIDSNEIIEYQVSGDKFEVVDIHVGYTRSIVNNGEVDLVAVMWANERFDPENPDTYYLEV